MAGRLLALSARSLRVRMIPMGACGAHGASVDPMKDFIGNREVVGYGYNGQPYYADRADFPFPALRWKESDNNLKALREKEKGDWRQMSLDEKKCLYRASFCQTFAEFKAPTGDWKSTIGIGLIVASMGVWLFILMKIFVYNPLPISFSEEYQKAQLRRILDLHQNPVSGISSHWDYEKDTWKK